MQMIGIIGTILISVQKGMENEMHIWLQELSEDVPLSV